MVIEACPNEADPRPVVAEFVAKKEPSAIAGLSMEGMDTLVQIVFDEIKKQEPEANNVKVDREFLSDNKIIFPREFKAYIEKRLAEGKKLNLLICNAIPVQNWNMVVSEFKGQDISVYYCDYNYKLVPTCTKLPI